MLIDSCASGGHRNDLETMRRAVPFLRSDYIHGRRSATRATPTACRSGCPTTAPAASQTGRLRSPQLRWPARISSPAGTCAARSLDYDLLRRAGPTVARVRPQLLRRLLPADALQPRPDSWIAWQFDRPEGGRGHGPGLPPRRRASMNRPLQAPRPRSRGPLCVTDLDSGDSRTLTGRELMDKGLPVAVRRSQAPW